MQSEQDERIECADCGASFVFTSAEAAFYREKNLATPKRCRACRARKRAERPSRPSPSHGAASAGARPGRPRYTNDVNEYRSPMHDPSSSATPRRDDRFGPRPDRTERRAPADPRGGGRFARPADRSSGPPRPRSHGAMFDVHCSACGVATQVPFRPIEGRDVFCQPCYRARKP
jgi:CxxC-x17-CxxC domain-containing protein